MRFFLDTNITVDFIDTHRKQHSLAVEVICSLTKNNHQIVISEDILSTIFYICPDKQATLHKFKILQKDWDIVIFGKNVINDAINISIQKSIDLEDTLQCLCAKQNQCDFIISNDKNFMDCGVKIVNYNEFNKLTI